MKDRNIRIGVGCALIVPIIHPTTFKYLAPVIYSTGTPGDIAASGSSLVLPRAAAGTRGEHAICMCGHARGTCSALHYTTMQESA